MRRRDRGRDGFLGEGTSVPLGSYLGGGTDPNDRGAGVQFTARRVLCLRQAAMKMAGDNRAISRREHDGADAGD